MDLARIGPRSEAKGTLTFASLPKVQCFEFEAPPWIHSPIIKVSICGPEVAPAVVVLGGISADRFPCVRPEGTPGWWRGFAAPGGGVDPDWFRIVGMDFTADEKGIRAPSPAEQADAVAAVLTSLNIETAHAVVGASYGGMIALHFAAMYPKRLERLVVACADARPHPNSTASRELQRRVVGLGIATGLADEALAIARGMAMLTYRCPAEFQSRFEGGISGEHVLDWSQPGEYLRARGKAYAEVMSPERFLSLSASIDRHDVDPRRVETPALLIGSKTDQLVPPEQMKSLAERLPRLAGFHLIPSPYGHDAFLKDADKLSEIVRPFLRCKL